MHAFEHLVERDAKEEAWATLETTANIHPASGARERLDGITRGLHSIHSHLSTHAPSTAPFTPTSPLTHRLPLHSLPPLHSLTFYTGMAL